MADRPTISVCMAVYNAERYVSEAVRSILDQTFGDFEFIIVDDGSTDGSLRILQEMAVRDARIRVISRANTGVAGAANDAIAAARCEFIARMDSDDIAMPERFEKQLDFMRAHPQVVLLGSRSLLIDPYGSPLYETDQPLDHEGIDELMLQGVGWAVTQPVSMIRASALRQAGPYRIDRVPSEDLEMFLRLAEIGRVANLPEVLLKYRQHPRSANHTRSAEQNKLKGTIIREAYQRRGMELPPGWTPPQRNVLPLKKEIKMWAWVALKKGNVSAARRHAVDLLKRSPFSPEAWRLMFCAIRGR